MDIYDNVDILAVHYDKLQEENEQLIAHVRSLENDIDKLCNEIKSMKMKQDDLTRNISELFNTAKSEIQRKDRTIAELRKQLEEANTKQSFNPHRRPYQHSKPHENNELNQQKSGSHYKTGNKESNLFNNDSHQKSRESQQYNSSYHHKSGPNHRRRSKSPLHKRRRSRSRSPRDHRRRSKSPKRNRRHSKTPPKHLSRSPHRSKSHVQQQNNSSSSFKKEGDFNKPESVPIVLHEIKIENEPLKKCDTEMKKSEEIEKCLKKCDTRNKSDDVKKIPEGDNRNVTLNKTEPVLTENKITPNVTTANKPLRNRRKHCVVRLTC